MTVIIDFETSKNMDMNLIPYKIYDDTINKRTIKIQNYFILNPYLMYSFVGYNGALKLANQLASNKKCGCFYDIPWITHYANVNETKKTTLSFSQQVDEYRYMIKFWYPSPEISYMQYLSQIALGMILDISRFYYNITNNLDTCSLFSKKWYSKNFDNPKKFLNYISKYI
jgi:hypothetical protein